MFFKRVFHWMWYSLCLLCLATGIAVGVTYSVLRLSGWTVGETEAWFAYIKKSSRIMPFIILPIFGQLMILMALLVLLISSARADLSEKAPDYQRYMKGWKRNDLLQCILAALLVLATWQLSSHFFPCLQTANWYLFCDVFFVPEEPSRPQATPPWLIKTAILALSAFSFYILLPGLAHAAYVEECTYRQGTKTWTDAFIRSAKFGLAHPFFLPMLPIGLALPLSAVGLWLTIHYWRGGLSRSTMYHSLYNLIAIPLIVGSLIVL